MLLEGLFLPLTTPFYPDGRCYIRKLEHNVELYSKTPAAGLMVLGETAEPTMLAEEEIRQVMKAAIGAAADEKVMLVGISRDSVVETVNWAQYAASLGYDAVVVGVPSILRGGRLRKEVVTYFQAVADRSALPVVLRSSAEVQGGELDVQVVIELAGHPNVIGLVDDAGGATRVAEIKTGTASVKRDVVVTPVFAAVTGRMTAKQRVDEGGLLSAASLAGGGTASAGVAAKGLLKTRTKSVGFQMLASNTAWMLEGLRAGATGVAPAFGACAPQACYEVVAAWKDGDEGLADEKQARIVPAAALVEEKLGVPGIKLGCDLNGYYGGAARLPLLPLTGEQRSDVGALMHGIRS